jgi:hypothetical protein
MRRLSDCNNLVRTIGAGLANIAPWGLDVEPLTNTLSKQSPMAVGIVRLPADEPYCALGSTLLKRLKDLLWARRLEILEIAGFELDALPRNPPRFVVAIGLGGSFDLLVGVKQVSGRRERLEIPIDDIVNPLSRISNDCEEVIVRRRRCPLR